MKATNPLLAVLALTGIAVIPGCGTGEASVTDAAEVRAAMPVPVETSAPVRADIFATYHATSTIESDVDAPVLARVDGEVVQLLVEEGDVVTAGQVLARLDGERLRLEMLSARADLERVSGELERYDDLAARGLISAAMYDGLKFDMDALKARYDLARLNYEYSAIRATISGVVSARDIKLGQHRRGLGQLSVEQLLHFVARLQVGGQGLLPGFESGFADHHLVGARRQREIQAGGAVFLAIDRD